MVDSKYYKTCIVPRRIVAGKQDNLFNSLCAQRLHKTARIGSKRIVNGDDAGKLSADCP